MLLGACASAPPVVAPAPVRELEAMRAFESWQAHGRIAVRAGDEGFSARFDWRQGAGLGDLSVRGPFGAGTAHLTITPQRIRIESGNAPPIEVEAPFAELEPTLVARLGFPLPLSALRYWLLGVPAPEPQVAIGPDGAFEQLGWRIEPRGFAVAADAPGPLPGQVQLSRGTTRIRVLVDLWQAGAP
jgi:outer membrane lipoprotein LolB